tara:strand:- start:137 stop:478 length:342 start_codon:yes stop_codon:yes gene_type:complete
MFRKNNMGHCGMLGFDPKQKKWIAIEHIHKRLDINILDGEDVAKVFDYVKDHNGKFIKAKLFRQKFRLFQAAWLREHSCVTIVMRILGINKLIITPYQLYKYLKKQDCEQWDF